jgi:hypothetical protein
MWIIRFCVFHSKTSLSRLLNRLLSRMFVIRYTHNTGTCEQPFCWFVIVWRVSRQKKRGSFSSKVEFRFVAACRASFCAMKRERQPDRTRLNLPSSVVVRRASRTRASKLCPLPTYLPTRPLPCRRREAIAPPLPPSSSTAANVGRALARIRRRFSSLPPAPAAKPAALRRTPRRRVGFPCV